MSDKVVIFLDIDGVLNGFRSLMAYGGYAAKDLDPVAIRLLNRLCQELIKVNYEPVIVISSTWRMQYPAVSWWQDLWAQHDCCALRTIGMTDTGPGKRGEQVARWMAAHDQFNRFVCIDDDSDFLPEQPLILTSFENGLQLDHIAKAFEILTGEPAIWAPRIFAQPASVAA